MKHAGPLLLVTAGCVTTTGLAATMEVAGLRREAVWKDGELVCPEPGFHLDRARYADPNTLAYVEGAALPESRDIRVAATATGRYGKSAGDYAAHDFDLRLMRSIGEVMAVRVELGFSAVDIGNSLPASDQTGSGLRRIGIGAKALGRTPEHGGWATAAVTMAGIHQLDPVTGRSAPGFYCDGYVAAEYRMCDRLTYAANYGYGINTADHLITDGRTDHTLYLDFQLRHGLAWQVTGNFSLGLENRLRTDFIDFERFDATAIHLGPSCHYASGNTSATLAVFPQLWGKPNHHGHRDLVAHEKLEVRLQLAFVF